MKTYKRAMVLIDATPRVQYVVKNNDVCLLMCECVWMFRRFYV